MGYGQIGFSQLATLYYKVPIQATSGGIAVNPSSYPVVFAFMPQVTQQPQTSDWVTGSWEAVPNNLLYPYSARCLVGPSGTITLATGVWVVFYKITGNPEVDADIAGYLEIR